MSVVVNVDVPSLLFDLLLSPCNPQLQASSTSGMGLLLSRCVHLLRALSRNNDVIQKRICDMTEALLGVQTIHSDIAVLVRDVS